jgi:hypothetical protein
MTCRDLVFAIAVLAGCSQSLGRLDTIGAPVASNDAPFTGPRVQGKSCVRWVLGFPTGAPSLEKATRAAQAKNGGGPLEEVGVSKTFLNAMVYGQECLVVEARATTAQ